MCGLAFAVTLALTPVSFSETPPAAPAPASAQVTGLPRVAPDPLRARYTIRMKGARLKVSGLTGSKAQDGLPWRRGSLRQYFQLVPDAAGNTGSWCRTFSPVE